MGRSSSLVLFSCADPEADSRRAAQPGKKRRIPRPLNRAFRPATLSFPFFPADRPRRTRLRLVIGLRRSAPFTRHADDYPPLCPLTMTFFPRSLLFPPIFLTDPPNSVRRRFDPSPELISRQLPSFHDLPRRRAARKRRSPQRSSTFTLQPADLPRSF